MPRYFIHLIDGGEYCDKNGVALPDASAARALAIRATGEALRDLGQRSWTGSELITQVTDEHGSVLWRFRFAADQQVCPS